MTWTMTKNRMSKFMNQFMIAAYRVVKDEYHPDLELFAKGAGFGMRYIYDIMKNANEQSLYDQDAMRDALTESFDAVIDAGPEWTKN